MARYIVLTPAGEPAESDRALILRDGFAFLAAVFPFIWFLVHRMWLWAALCLAISIGLALLLAETPYEGAGSIVSALFALFIGFEAQAMRVATLTRRGYVERAAIVAATAGDAEAIYYAGLAGTAEEAGSPHAPRPPASRPAGAAPLRPSTGGAIAQGPALGLFQPYGRG